MNKKSKLYTIAILVCVFTVLGFNQKNSTAYG